MSENALIQMPVEQRAMQAMDFDQVKANAAALVAESSRILEITSPAGYAECHSARMRLKSTRVAIEKVAKAAREDAYAFQKAVIAKERELIAVLTPEEDRLAVLQEAEDARKAAEKRAREEAERQRIVEINAKFDALKDLPRQTLTMDVDGIQRLILQAENFSAEGFPEEYRAAARFEKTKVLGQLEEALEVRYQMIEQEKRIAAERIELEQLRKEREQREAAERAEAEQRDQAEAEERRLRAESEARERAEADRQRREELARREAELAEQERIASEKRAEEDRKAQAERDRLAAEQRVEADRQAAERRCLEEEAVRLGREREEREIANASLIEAATDALAALRDLAPRSKVTRKLAAALEREHHRKAA